MDIIEKALNRIAAQKSPDVFDDIDISEWHTIRDLAESKTGKILDKMQDRIYNWYVRKLVGELRLAARANKNVDAIMYGGLLEGIASVSIKRLHSEAGNRIENWERKNNPDKPLT